MYTGSVDGTNIITPTFNTTDKRYVVMNSLVYLLEYRVDKRLSCPYRNIFIGLILVTNYGCGAPLDP